MRVGLCRGEALLFVCIDSNKCSIIWNFYYLLYVNGMIGTTATHCQMATGTVIIRSGEIGHAFAWRNKKWKGFLRPAFRQHTDGPDRNVWVTCQLKHLHRLCVQCTTDKRTDCTYCTCLLICGTVCTYAWKVSALDTLPAKNSLSMAVYYLFVDESVIFRFVSFFWFLFLF